VEIVQLHWCICAQSTCGFVWGDACGLLRWDAVWFGRTCSVPAIIRVTQNFLLSYQYHSAQQRTAVQQHRHLCN